MKKFLLIAFSIPIVLLGIDHAAQDANALDAPHNTNNQSWSITCTRCHYSPTGPTPTWTTLPTTTDETFKNNLCKDCHSASGMPLADPRYTNVRTHSATETASSYWGGNWSVECIICHSPHYQQQATNAAYSAETGVNARTGTTSSIATSVGALTSSLTDTAGSFPVNGYVGYLLVPNIAYPTRVYRINANDATTITVDGAINLNYAAPGKTYGIRYGKMINANMLTPNSGVKQVKFFNETGPNSFGSGVNAVCQVCHTLTTSFKNDGTKEAGSHPPGVAETQACTDCHAHADGFKKGGCTECHGDPPTNGATLVFADKDGLPVSSDSPGAGAHLKHTTTGNLTCVNCHTGGMLSGATAGDNLINIGFRLGGSNLGGNYDGKTGRTVYPYAGGGSTTVSAGNSLQCSSVYCHSSGQAADGGGGAPVYASPAPAWTTPASGACGTCHGTNVGTLTTGGHVVHLGNAGVKGCGDCHSGAANDASSYLSTNHVNRSIDVMNDYNMGGTPGNGYGTCATATCHQTGITLNDYVVTPVWNFNSPNCTVCHANVPATGAHGVHVTSAAYDCSQCHTSAIKDTSYASAQHLDLNIDVAVGGYPANKAIGSARQSCTSTCHGSRSPVWNDLSGTEGDCSLCHGMAASASDARDTNGDTAATDQQVGAHYAHLTGVSVYSSPLSCTDCHTVPAGATYMDKVKAAGHIDGDNQAELIFSGLATTNGATPSYVFGAGTCSNVYCHGAKMVYLSTNGTDTRPEWSQDTYLNSTPAKAGDCGVCHGAPPNTASHSGSEPLSACTGCHDHVNAAGSFNNKALHIDGMVQAAGCTGCHGQPPIGTGTMVNTTLTGRTTLFPASNGGAGAHNLHVNSKSIGCNRCHNSGGDSGHQTRLQVTFGFTYGLNGGLYQAPTFSNSYGLRSDGTTTVQITGSTRTCSSIYCHSSGQAADGGASGPVFATANWDVPSSGACGACHATTAGTTLGLISTGSHTKHLGNPVVSCESCHTGAGTGVAGSPDYTDNASHLNQLIEVANSYTQGGAPGNGYGTCTTACHSATNVAIATPTWGQAATCASCHPTVPITGSHTKHLAGTVYHQPVCGDCHDGAVQGTTAPVSHMSGTVDVYAVTPGDLGYPAVAKHSDTTYQNCTTASCHSSGQSLSSGTSATPVYSSVTWSTSVTCGGCHAATKASVSAANSGSHAVHLNNAVVSGCDACHTGVNAAGTTYSSSTASHVDGQINVASSLNYPLAGTPGNGYGRCNATACHGSQSPVWGSNTTVNQCTKCHGTPTAGASVAEYLKAPPQDTNLQTAATDSQVGAHQAHLTTSNYRGPIACSSCHTVPGAVETAGHIDSLLPAELTFSGLSTTYHSASAPTPTYNYTTGTCSTTYCHDGAYIKNGSAWSNGTGTAPVWTNTAYLNATPTAADCGKCHGYPPGGTHDPSTSCSGCHDNVRSSDNLGFTPAGLALHMDGSLHGGGDACIDCHGGLMTSGLHSAHTNTTVLAGKSLAGGDYGTGSWWYSYTYSNGVADASCGYCHPSTSSTHRNGIRNLDLLTTDATNTWIAGTVKVRNAVTPSYTQNPGVSVTCSSTYCHSNGYSPSGDGATNHDYAYQTSPDWYDTGYPTTDGSKCASCHGNWPNDVGQKTGSLAHTAHAVGIHYDDIYTGTSGLMTTGASNTNSHGNAAYSTTINCNICHNGTVTMSRNKVGSQCVSCHSGDVAGNIMAIAAGSTTHVNGTPDITLATLTNTLRSKAQLRGTTALTPWSRVTGYKVAGAYDQSSLAAANYNGVAKTCTTACHFNNAVQWNTSVSCSSCHAELP